MGRPAISEAEFEKEQERIRDAAQNLFEQGGREAVTLRAISKAIGSSAMQPYRYFPGGKNEILATVKARAFDRFGIKLQQATSEELDDIELIEAYCGAYVDFALEDPSSFSLMFEQNIGEDEAYPELTKAEARAKGPMIALIQNIVKTRHIEEDAGKVAHVLWASVHGLVMLHLSGQLKYGYVMEDIAPVLAKTLKAGLLPDA
jgi:AcrR family transcriptional regulator